MHLIWRVEWKYLIRNQKRQKKEIIDAIDLILRAWLQDLDLNSKIKNPRIQRIKVELLSVQMLMPKLIQKNFWTNTRWWCLTWQRKISMSLSDYLMELVWVSLTLTTLHYSDISIPWNIDEQRIFFNLTWDHFLNFVRFLLINDDYFTYPNK